MTPFERLAEREFFGVKLGLDNVRALTSAIDHPERACPRVIIAGTNGKGSVAAMVSRALHAAGRRVGLYTSPHLVHLTERFRIAERDVRQETLADVLAALFETEEALRAGGRLPGPCTYFELTTVAAFELFRREGVDAAVLEVGLGGRFDATNVAAAPLAGITSVGLDHVAQLGATVEAIAAEKAGVIQPHATVVSGVRHGRAREVIAQAAEASGARLVDAHADVQVEHVQRGLDTWLTLRTPRAAYGPLPLALRGAHQVANAVVAVRLLEAFDAQGIVVPREAIETGLREAVWPARLQVVRRVGRPLMVIDGAHNADGAAALAAWLDAAALRGVTLVTAVMRDKDAAAVLGPLAARASAAVALQVHPPRGLTAAEVAAELHRSFPMLPVTPAADAAAALEAACARGAPIVVAGSLFLAGAMLEALGERPWAP